MMRHLEGVPVLVHLSSLVPLFCSPPPLSSEREFAPKMSLECLLCSLLCMCVGEGDSCNNSFARALVQIIYVCSITHREQLVEIINSVSVLLTITHCICKVFLKISICKLKMMLTDTVNVHTIAKKWSGFKLTNWSSSTGPVLISG